MGDWSEHDQIRRRPIIAENVQQKPSSFVHEKQIKVSLYIEW